MEKKLAQVYEEIENLVGSENMMKLFDHFHGQQLSFPQRLYNIEYVSEYCKEHYNGKNLRELSAKFGYSDRRIRQLLDLRER